MRERQEAIIKESCAMHTGARVHTHTHDNSHTRLGRKQPLFSGFYFEDLWRREGVAEGVGPWGRGKGGNNASFILFSIQSFIKHGMKLNKKHAGFRKFINNAGCDAVSN